MDALSYDFRMLLAGILLLLFAAEREVDPTWLRRSLASVPHKPADVATATSRYRPLFGDGDSHARLARSVARYGELTIEPGGSSAVLSRPAEEQIYVVLDGAGVLLYGNEKYPVRRNDFFYVAPGVRHGIENPGSAPCRLLLMGFRTPADTTAAPSKPPLANIDEVPLQTVGGHPPSTQYRLMLGTVDSQRDRLAAAQVATSLFIMEFAPGGTNFPHHHETEEEIYLVLDGRGEMVAGGGMDGVEGRHAAQAGDAYFFRLNCTVGFYNTSGEKARILAVRSLYPRRRGP
jgi:mannose-6-phosphate isomerase-like protein (cupin superfamily)